MPCSDCPADSSSKLQAQIKLLEPGAYVSTAVLEDVVLHQQTLAQAEHYRFSRDPNLPHAVADPQKLAQSAASNFVQLTEHMHSSQMDRLKAIAKYGDLATEKPIAATRGSEKIVVEVKSFVGRSLMHDFQQALGQYLVYRRLIELTEPECQVYLAIDDVIYRDFFSEKAIQVVVQANQLLLIVVDIEQEEIVQWTS